MTWTLFFQMIVAWCFFVIGLGVLASIAEKYRK